MKSGYSLIVDPARADERHVYLLQCFEPCPMLFAPQERQSSSEVVQPSLNFLRNDVFDHVDLDLSEALRGQCCKCFLKRCTESLGLLSRFLLNLDGFGLWRATRVWRFWSRGSALLCSVRGASSDIRSIGDVGYARVGIRLNGHLLPVRSARVPFGHLEYRLPLLGRSRSRGLLRLLYG